ncbi:protein yellow-like isoform X2 [Cloeon dipterum]|uniref:protein yellow-like isoform X2 n=1 Tax=Cloeon dipterum TaxID=197152 RepID=UPI0032204ACF
MTPFLTAIFLLGLSSGATAANFSPVFEWNELDFNWPSEASRTTALKDGTFKPENIDPRFMAVHGSRIFLSLDDTYGGIPVTLGSLPTSGASSAPPKLTPFPSWDMHVKGDCDKLERTKGLEVDSVGRLWVLDSGGDDCYAKIWTIDLNNNDHTKIIHRFPVRRLMQDLVLDETPDGTFAYISQGIEQNVVVFSLERNQSWIVKTPEIEVFSIALSPKKDQEPRQLYLSKWYSKELYSISVAALRNGAGTENPRLIGKWTADPYRMLLNNQGTMFTALLRQNYISSWNTSQPFAEQRFHEVAGLNSGLPFTFALDQSGTLWMTVFDNKKKPRYRLLKAAVSEQSLMASPDAANAAEYGVKGRKLIDSSVFFVFLLAVAIL